MRKRCFPDDGDKYKSYSEYSKDNMRHTQEAVVLCVWSIGSEREVKKEKYQIMEGLKALAQDFRLFL